MPFSKEAPHRGHYNNQYLNVTKAWITMARSFFSRNDPRLVYQPNLVSLAIAAIWLPKSMCRSERTPSYKHESSMEVLSQLAVFIGLPWSQMVKWDIIGYRQHIDDTLFHYSWKFYPTVLCGRFKNMGDNTEPCRTPTVIGQEVEWQFLNNTLLPICQEGPKPHQPHRPYTRTGLAFQKDTMINNATREYYWHSNSTLHRFLEKTIFCKYGKNFKKKKASCCSGFEKCFNFGLSCPCWVHNFIQFAL